MQLVLIITASLLFVKFTIHRTAPRFSANVSPILAYVFLLIIIMHLYSAFRSEDRETGSKIHRIQFLFFRTRSKTNAEPIIAEPQHKIA